MTTFLSQEKIARIDRAGRTILKQTGVKILDPESLDLLAAEGAAVDREAQTARFDDDWITEKVGLAPPAFTLYSRDGENDLEMGSGAVYFGNGGRVFQILDLKTNGFRPTLLRDVAHTARLVHQLDNIHFYIIACQANDIPADHYHLNDFFYALSNTTKHVMGGCDTLEGAKEMHDLAAFIAGGADALRGRPFVSVITNPISPLTFGQETLKILEFCARNGIPVTCAPAPISGATAPAALAGTLAQMHAEALAGVALSQAYAPGARTLYGAVPMTMDLRTMNISIGSVETALMNTGAVHLAKRNNLPIYASAGVTDAKTPDIQSGFEKGVSCLLVGMAGGDYIHLAAGMLDSGNSVSYEQYVIDNEILGMVYRALKGIELNDETLALDCIDQVGPGGNFVTEDHTVDHMFSEFFYPELAVRMNFDVWAKAGEPSPLTNAQKRVADYLDIRNPLMPLEVLRDIRKRFPGIIGL